MRAFMLMIYLIEKGEDEDNELIDGANDAHSDAGAQDD